MFDNSIVLNNGVKIPDIRFSLVQFRCQKQVIPNI